MFHPVSACLLLLAVTFAGCADDAPEGSPDPTPSTSQGTTTAQATSTTSATASPSSSSSTSTAPHTPETKEVDISGSAFSPQSVSIRSGDTVHWTQEDASTHTVTSDAGAPETFDSGDLTLVVNPEFSHTFEAVGTYHYHCAKHPGMTGTVTVAA